MNKLEQRRVTVLNHLASGALVNSQAVGLTPQLTPAAPPPTPRTDPWRPPRDHPWRGRKRNTVSGKAS